MSSITRKGDIPPHANPAKRLPPPTADKSYDRHIAEQAVTIKFMRDSGMLDDGPVPQLSAHSVPSWSASDPDHRIRDIPLSELSRGIPQRSFAHLYQTEDFRPAVMGQQKGPRGNAIYTASAGYDGHRTESGRKRGWEEDVGAYPYMHKSAKFGPTTTVSGGMVQYPDAEEHKKRQAAFRAATLAKYRPTAAPAPGATGGYGFTQDELLARNKAKYAALAAQGGGFGPLEQLRATLKKKQEGKGGVTGGAASDFQPFTQPPARVHTDAYVKSMFGGDSVGVQPHMAGGAWWDVFKPSNIAAAFDPNKNGVANAFKPENIAKAFEPANVAAAFDPAKNGVAEAFKAENVVKALDPAKNGFNDVSAKLVNELGNPDSALRSNIAPQLLGPLGGIALQGLNSLQRAATNGTFTSGPDEFFKRLGNEFTNSNSDLVTKLLPAATRAVTGVNPNTLLKGLNGVRDMMQPQPMEEVYGEDDEEVDTGVDGADEEEEEEEEDEEEDAEEQAEEEDEENVPFEEEAEEPADMYEQAEEEKEEAEEEAEEAKEEEEQKSDDAPPATPSEQSARDGTEAKLISKLAWLFENPGEALPPGEATGSGVFDKQFGMGGSRRRHHRARSFNPRLLGMGPPPPLYAPGAFARN